MRGAEGAGEAAAVAEAAAFSDGGHGQAGVFSASSAAPASLRGVANDPVAAHLARPSANQYAWHEQERTLFVCLGVATWEGTEYDADGKTDLTKLNPEKFDANQLCAAAQSWGAKLLLLVCKHVGGFCRWPTGTTPYNISNTPWKGGKGNMVKEVADACRKHGLKMLILINQFSRITQIRQEPRNHGNHPSSPERDHPIAR